MSQEKSVADWQEAAVQHTRRAWGGLVLPELPPSDSDIGIDDSARLLTTAEKLLLDEDIARMRARRCQVATKCGHMLIT